MVVPIGLGSGACGVIAARDALGLDTEVIGVVSDGAPAYALSLAAGRAIAHEVTTELADGMACRVPEEAALDILKRGLSQVVSVSDADIAAAMRCCSSARTKWPKVPVRRRWPPRWRCRGCADAVSR